MQKKTLFHELTGIDVQTPVLKPSPLRPESTSYTLLLSGYMMEYFRVGPAEQKVVALFWGPQEHVVASHRDFSRFQILEEGMNKVVTHEEIIYCLLLYAGVREIYWHMREIYRKKVADRIYMAQHMTPVERYAHLKTTQPWVLDLADEEDVANYLGVTVGMLRRFSESILSI